MSGADDDGECATTITDASLSLLERADARARLAARATGGDAGSRHPLPGEVGHDLAVDGLDRFRRRREQVLHQGARHGTQRHDEGVDADVDRPLAALDGELLVLAHPEDHVGRHLPRPEGTHRPLPRREVRLDPPPGLPGGDPREHLRVEGGDGAARLQEQLRALPQYANVVVTPSHITIFNTDARVKGAELELDSNPLDGFTVGASVAYLDAIAHDVRSNLLGSGVNLGDQRMPQSPEWSANGLLRYVFDLGSGQLALQTDARYNSKRFFNTVNHPALVDEEDIVVNARIAYTIGDGAWEANGRNAAVVTIVYTAVSDELITGLDLIFSGWAGKYRMPLNRMYPPPMISFCLAGMEDGSWVMTMPAKVNATGPSRTAILPIVSSSLRRDVTAFHWSLVTSGFAMRAW
mgnify:CR=1 FL=1